MLSWQLLRRVLSSVIPCSLVDKYQCFIGICCLCLLDKRRNPCRKRRTEKEKADAGPVSKTIENISPNVIKYLECFCIVQN
jgi:hypothetical protein